ncbi:MAG: carbohydrate-binding domain-containing protein [Actinomycetaceae bacterium]|nr:carbohydrate-binding domain-containing protein [Actinomycetaceae bacterium]
MNAKKTWMALALAASLGLGACGGGNAASAAGGAASKSAASSGAALDATTSTDGLATLDALRETSETSLPSGDVYAGTVTAQEATIEAMMAENQRPHADSNDAEYDASAATTVTLDGSSATVEGDGAQAADGTVTISAGGTYILTGEFEGQVLVEASDADKVTIVLDGVNISSSDDAAIRVVQADEAVLVLAEGTTNSVSDTASYSEDYDGPTAAIASKADLTVGGSGTLDVQGNGNDGVSSSDGLVIIGGTIDVTAVDDGVRGQDYVVLAAGTLSVQAQGDAIKSDNESDAGRGYVLVTGGEATLSAGSDAIDATSDLMFAGGAVTVSESEEGFESSNMLLAGGSADITSSDDGLNAVDGTPWLAVTGGEWVLDSEGDGFDSNGEGYISGGSVTVYGPTNGGNGAIDAEGGVTVTGGTLFAIGSAGMDQAPRTGGEQSAIKVQTNVAEGATVAIADSSGNEIASYTSRKRASSIVFSSAGIAEGQEYMVLVDGEKAATATGGDYVAGESMLGGGQGAGGQMPDGQAPGGQMPGGQGSGGRPGQG